MKADIDTFDFSGVTENQVILVRLSKLKERPSVEVLKLAEALRPRVPNGTLILFMDSNDSIEVLSEKKMKESGWVRKI